MRNDFIRESFDPAGILDPPPGSLPDPTNALPDDLPDWMEDDSYKECRDVEVDERENCKENVDNRDYYQVFLIFTIILAIAFCVCIVIFFYFNYSAQVAENMGAAANILKSHRQWSVIGKVGSVGSVLIGILTLSLTIYFYTKLSDKYSKFKMSWGGNNRNKVLNYARNLF